jgi:hypothetical protein
LILAPAWIASEAAVCRSSWGTRPSRLASLGLLGRSSPVESSGSEDGLRRCREHQVVAALVGELKRQLVAQESSQRHVAHFVALRSDASWVLRFRRAAAMSDMSQ